MHAPLASTITLIMELFVASLIFFVVYFGYARNIFAKKLALFAMVYEIFFNVGYMLYRSLVHSKTYVLNPALKIVAMLHGVLSLAMLGAVVIFFMLAWKNYAKGIDYFLAHRMATIIFIFFWVVSLVSGLFLYLEVYF